MDKRVWFLIYNQSKADYFWNGDSGYKPIKCCLRLSNQAKHWSSKIKEKGLTVALIRITINRYICREGRTGKAITLAIL